ncbi:MAG: tripartite tricarboxylate transporter substrate binding protein [Pseudomonadota bacterium]
MRLKISSLPLVLFAALSIVTGAVHGQSAFPTKPIKIVVPFPPGGSPDLLARTVGQKLQEMWQQPVVVENVPGAGGTIGAQNVARAPADGHTWLVAPNNVLIFAPLLQQVPFDPVKSFAPVALAISVQNLLVVNPSVPAKNVAELISLAKSQPGKISYASGGLGSPQNFSTELLKSMAGLDVVHVPYKGAQAAMPDVLSGLVPVFISQANSLLPLIESGKLRLLAGTGEKRYATLPNVPTVAETVPGYAVDIWSGFVMPANTPKDIVDKSSAAVRQILALPEVQAIFNKQGIEVSSSTPEQMANVIRSDITRWAKVVKDANIKAE